jgi:hypothetical protein
MWLAAVAGEGKSAPKSVGAGGSHHRRQLKRLGVAISFFPVTAPKEVKERDWKATGNLPVTGRGGEGEHTERRHAATMLICEEEEHCAAGSDGTMKDDDSGKKRENDVDTMHVERNHWENDVDTVHVERNHLINLSEFSLYS